MSEESKRTQKLIWGPASPALVTALIFSGEATPAQNKLLDQLVGILNSDPAIPSSPFATERLKQKLEDPDANLDDVAMILNHDPGLASRLLNMGNASVYGRGKRVTSLAEALSLIGLRESRRIVAATEFIRNMRDFNGTVDWEKFWRHSILVAHLNEIIADAFLEDVQGEHLAGLMHDVGKMILAKYFPSEYARVIALASHRGMQIHVTEQEIFGTNHARVSAALCAKWALPDRTIDAVLHHHDVMIGEFRYRSPSGQLAACCLATSNAMARVGMDDFLENNATSAEEFAQLPEWLYLQSLGPKHEIHVDVALELQRAETLINSGDFGWVS